MNDMASPQLENGHIRIATELWEALCGIRISGEVRQCLDVIIRKTYGFHKKEDKISLSQFCLLTKMAKPRIRHAIVKLLKMNLIVAKNGKTNGNYYRFNKDFDTWKPLPKKASVAKNGKTSLPIIGTTIDTNTKDNITRSPLRASRDSKNMKLRNENAFSDEHEKAIDAETNAPKEDKRENMNERWKKFRVYFLDECQNYRGFRPILAMKDKAAFHSADKQYSVAELKSQVEYFLKSEKSEKHLSVTACFSADSQNQWRKWYGYKK